MIKNIILLSTTVITLFAAEPTTNIIQNIDIKADVQNKVDEVTKNFQDSFKKEVLKQADTLKDSALKSDMIKEIQNLKDVTTINDTLEKFGNLGVPGTADIASKGITSASASMGTQDTFACVCAADLGKAFQDIRKHVFADNLNKVSENLDVLNGTIEANTKTLEAQVALLNTSNKVYVEKIIEAKRYLYNLQKQKQIIKED
ncbi:MAG: hypothetical protein A3F91_09500 [Flavobacteria bacterium RIFCSPLOWO2_12_FULL_35_11]|nr:MAG: hypothetical protein A3F91_09500 [Flavobacteria bacterium RIFCSPLOWO2_12_FULL_35_11]